MKVLLNLCRVSNLPTIWSNVACCALLVFAEQGGSPAEVRAVFFLLVSLSCFYSGGMVLNDVCDANYDRQYQAFRPIPSGLISRQKAAYFAAILFLVAFAGLALTPNPLGLFAGAGLLAVVSLYDFFHKKHSASIFLMAAARALVYWVTALALTGTIPATVIFISLIQGAYILVLTAVARYESKYKNGRYPLPVVPWMIAAIALIDGIFLAISLHPAWLLLGVSLMLFTRYFQRFIRGD